MKVIVDIKDNQAGFGMKVLQSLSFIRKARPLSSSAAILWDDLKEAAEEVRLHKKGKLQLKSARELLNEL